MSELIRSDFHKVEIRLEPAGREVIFVVGTVAGLVNLLDEFLTRYAVDARRITITITRPNADD